VRTVSLFEHESAIVANAPGDKQFTGQELAILDRAQHVQGVDAFRWSSRNRIKANQFVGMLTGPGIRLEILPKIDGLGKGPTRHTLMRMIATAWDVPVWEGEIADHDYQDTDLLELLIRVFAHKLLQQSRSGLHRAYQGKEDDLGRLRGKMNVTRQFTYLAAQPQLLACRYEDFTSDNALNRLLLCAVGFLSRRSIRPETHRLLSEIRCHFEEVAEVSIRKALSGQLTLDRTNQRWALLATLARRFLQSAYQTAHSGADQGIALLFDMNRLFEAYVSALARRVGVPLGYKVRTQGPKNCLAKNDESQSAFQTKPDVTLQRGSDIIVLDTKWKRLDSKRPNFDVAQADAYQMHGYAHVYGSNSVILIYPHHLGIPHGPGQQARWKFVSSDASLLVATIDLSAPAQFSEVLRQLLP
jgi:5-methylcytosine-specific restriction enzyme subunit McrC